MLKKIADPDDAETRLRFRKLRSDRHVFILNLVVAAECRVPMSKYLWRFRGTRRIVVARQLAMYLAHVFLGRPQHVVAELFGRDRTTVAHACQAIEDRRDNRAFEGLIARIEARLMQNCPELMEQRDAA